LQNAIREFPTYFSALIRLGLLEIELRNFDGAQEAFGRAVAVNDRSLTGWYGLSYSDFALNKMTDAISAAEKALEIDRSSADIFLLLGVMQRKVKNYVVAEKSLLQAKKLYNGHSSDIHWNLALLYAHNLGNYAAVASELEAYLKWFRMFLIGVTSRSLSDNFVRKHLKVIIERS
jgi:tetratricopeptide (TPR) repeat protein